MTSRRESCEHPRGPSFWGQKQPRVLPGQHGAQGVLVQGFWERARFCSFPCWEDQETSDAFTACQAIKPKSDQF